MNDRTEDTLHCTEIRLEFLDLLQDRPSPARIAAVESHLAGCRNCAEELSSLRQVWSALPEPEKAIPPVAVRASALDHAGGPVDEAESVLHDLWKAVRGVAVPVALGAGASALVVLLMHLRGAMAPLEHLTVAALSLALAATLAAVAGGLRRRVTPRRVRAVLLGSVGALGGYLVLSVISPIPDTVQLCRVALFRNVPMSLGEVCLVYLVVAGLYAGVPMALAAYAEGGAGNPWRMGSAEAAIFMLLAAPTVVLQLGVEEAMFTLTVVLGVVAGSLAGGLSGAWIRSRRMLGATGLTAAVLLAPAGLGAQALPFHTETAITTGFEEGAARTFAMFAGREGLLVDGVEVPDPMRREIKVFVQPMVVLPYAINPMWTTRVIVPLVHKGMDFIGPDGVPRSFSTGGVGDVILDTKWVFLSKNRLGGTTRLGIGGGVKIPLGKTSAEFPDGTVAPRPLQVGTGSWDFPFKALFTLTEGHFGLLSNVGYRVNTTRDGFKAGNVFSYDVATALRFVPWVYRSLSDQSLVLYLELNGEVGARSEVGGLSAPDSGGHLLFLSPDLQWIPLPWLLFEGSVQLPIVQALNGTQLKHSTRFQLGTRFRFSFFR